MFRRNFIKAVGLTGLGSGLSLQASAAVLQQTTSNERAYWVKTLVRIADPVLTALAQAKLKATMPVEAAPGQETDRKLYTYLEALGRTLAGLAPWLELPADNTSEGKLREKYATLARQALANAVNPASPDYLNFTQGGQPVVDAAFLAHAILRAPRTLWEPLDKQAQATLIAALKATRVIKPHFNNWLLFSAMVEAALLKLSGTWDPMRVDYAIRQHEQWYKGDAAYGDGPDFHWDYYNSFVIQPMLQDVLKIAVERDKYNYQPIYDKVLKRASRFAEVQERLIAPDGGFPPIGRSLVYRCGAFQALSHVALAQQLPEQVKPAQVRGALTAVIKKTLEAPGTFDKNGWLTIGLCGHQPQLGEVYISTGSLYLCSTAFLPLGLPTSDPFWSAPAEPWTQQKIWSGMDVKADKALYG